MIARTKKTKEERAAEGKAALDRILAGTSDANYGTIIWGFAAKGVPADDIVPRQNVFTFAAWKAKGRQVRKGEHGVKVLTVVPCEKKEIDPVTHEEVEIKVEKKRRATVFHISQTDPLRTAQPSPSQNRPKPEPKQSPTRPSRPRRNLANPDTLRAKVDALQKQIDAKRNPAIAEQNPTRRRASIAASMRDDARRLEKVQQSLRNIADAIDAGTLPECLADVRHTSHVERIFRHYGIGTENPEGRQWLEDQLTGPTPEQRRRAAIDEAERELIWRKIPGFFPTPAAVVRRMIDRADITPQCDVLEPSAGKGDIAEQLRALQPNQLEVVEINGELCELLRLKGFEPHQTDFTQLAGAGFDRVVMNPPFENGTDIDHVRHAYDCLGAGGRLVAIMSEGPFYRNDKKATAFRDWLDQVGGTTEKLPEAFSGPQSFRQTGVATRLVVIDRKEG